MLFYVRDMCFRDGKRRERENLHLLKIGLFFDDSIGRLVSCSLNRQAILMMMCTARKYLIRSSLASRVPR